MSKQGYIRQMEEWFRKHPNATKEECYLAGYWNCTSNWVSGETFNKEPPWTNG